MTSSRHAGPAGAAGPVPRVRDQARDAVGLMAFSAAVSVSTALGLLLLTLLAGLPWTAR